MKFFSYKNTSGQQERPHLKVVVWGLLLFVVFLKVFFAVRSISVTASIKDLETEAEELRFENKKLQRELVEATSLIKLQEKAPELGFVATAKPYNLKFEGQKAQALR